jgi:hypothetical protein
VDLDIIFSLLCSIIVYYWLIYAITDTCFGLQLSLIDQDRLHISKQFLDQLNKYQLLFLIVNIWADHVSVMIISHTWPMWALMFQVQHPIWQDLCIRRWHCSCCKTCWYSWQDPNLPWCLWNQSMFQSTIYRWLLLCMLLLSVFSHICCFISVLWGASISYAQPSFKAYYLC